MVERQLVPVMALLPGDPEFGARNIWDWEAGGTPEGVRCRRVEQRFMDAGDFLLDWLACVFTATKSGDRENSGYEHSELVPAQPGSSQSGACWSCCLTAALTIPARSRRGSAEPAGHSWAPPSPEGTLGKLVSSLPHLQLPRDQPTPPAAGITPSIQEHCVIATAWLGAPAALASISMD